MPIVPLDRIKQRTEEQFHELDYRIMSLAFAVQNELGRLYEEGVYKNELSHRLLKSGIDSRREFQVRLMHGTFEKDYFIDLLVDGGVVYEAKVASALTGCHRTQTLNYLFLTNTHHGKLLNFRPVEVEHELVSTQLRLETRRQVQILDGDWQSVDRESARFKEIVTALVLDWGACLSLDAYREAAIHFFGGSAEVCREEELIYEGRPIGMHAVNHLTPNTIFAFSAIGEGISAMRKQLQKLLNMTRQKNLQWVNLHLQKLQFTTLIRDT